MRAKPTRLTEEARKLRAITEKKLQAKVMKLLKANGYLTWHAITTNQFMRPGMPDITAVRANPPDFLMLELKREQGELRPEQKIWIDTLRKAGVEVRIIRPSDYEWLKQRVKRPDGTPET